MDPKQTFNDMFDAMKSRNFETATELALALENWFAKGGFYPAGHAPEAMYSYIQSVLRRTGSHGPEPEFSLVCLYCDGGEGINSEEEAMDEGWTEIDMDTDLLQANFIGICPSCRSWHQS